MYQAVYICAFDEHTLKLTFAHTGASPFIKGFHVLVLFSLFITQVGVCM